MIFDLVLNVLRRLDGALNPHYKPHVVQDADALGYCLVRGDAPREPQVTDQDWRAIEAMLAAHRPEEDA